MLSGALTKSIHRLDLTTGGEGCIINLAKTTHPDPARGTVGFYFKEEIETFVFKPADTPDGAKR